VKKSDPISKETLKWVHIAISNVKRNFLGVYHKIKGENLQRYLNEFVYKLNRRYFNSVFERLLVASVFPYWYNSDQAFFILSKTKKQNQVLEKRNGNDFFH
jgi:hypothetical protein